MSEKIELSANGQIFDKWTQAIIKKSLYQITGAFALTSTDIRPEEANQWNLKMGDECKIEINNQTVITGYIEDIPMSYDENNHNISIGGRDKTGDLADCCFIETPNEWKELSIAEIIINLCEPFGINVNVDVSAAFQASEPRESFKTQHGVSIFDMILPILKINAILAVSYGDGSLVLTQAGSQHVNDNLTFGGNIKSGTLNQSIKDRFSQYTVVGQGIGNDDKEFDIFVSAIGQYEDSVITRYRPTIILPDGLINGEGDCYRLARWEARNRAGASIIAKYVVQGWTQSNGRVWPLNAIIHVKDDFFGINTNMLIAEITYKIDETTGTSTQLTLVDPKTFDLPPMGGQIRSMRTKSWRDVEATEGQ